MTEDSKSRCDALADLLPLAAIGDVTVEEDLAVEEHLAGCEPCRDEMEACRRLCEGVRRELAPVPAVPPEPMRPERPGTTARPPLSTSRLAVAAALLLVGIVVGRWSMLPASPEAPVRDRLTGDRSSLAARMPETSRVRAGALSVFSPAARPYLMAAARGGEPPGPGEKTPSPRN